MPLFKEVKKPVLKGAGKNGAEISPQRPRYVEKTAPCMHRCPNGNDIREAMVEIAQAKDYGRSNDEAFELAWQRVTATNPFPAVCGRICSHGCENGCNRKSKEGAVAINAVERFIGDFGIARKLKLPVSQPAARAERVAVMGAGAAGLSCAYHLARRGYRVTVFEAFSEAGGVFRYGVPRSRLPGEVLDAEIERILELGVELKLNCAVGWDVTAEEVRAEYQAVFAGVGAQHGVGLKIPGENAPNVYSGTAFLNVVNRGERTELGDSVVVIGGGLMAVETARVSRRLGAETTTIYRRGPAEMPAPAASIEAAMAAGVQFEMQAVPTAILQLGSKAVGVVCQRTEPGEMDATGRPAPVPVAGSEFELDATTVIECTGVEPQYFAPEALRSGKGRSGAEEIDGRLTGRAPAKKATPAMIGAEKMKLDWYAASPRHEAPAPKAASCLGPESPGLTEAEVIEEAKRCMSCGMCMDCETCWMYCTQNCFVKLPKGEHYKIKLEVCNGCRKCADACPCGYIELN